jgi:hypothetical protein
VLTAVKGAARRIVGVSFPLLHTPFTGSTSFWQLRPAKSFQLSAAKRRRMTRCAASAFIAWDRHRAEPTVMFNNVPIPISTIAGLAEVRTRCPPACFGGWSLTPTALLMTIEQRRSN